MSCLQESCLLHALIPLLLADIHMWLWPCLDQDLQKKSISWSLSRCIVGSLRWRLTTPNTIASTPTFRFHCKHGKSSNAMPAILQGYSQQAMSPSQAQTPQCPVRLRARAPTMALELQREQEMERETEREKDRKSTRLNSSH